MNDFIHSYTAGYFDGEGWIVFIKNKALIKYNQRNPIFSLRLGIESTDINTLAYLQKIYGGSLYTRRKKRAMKRRLTKL